MTRAMDAGSAGQRMSKETSVPMQIADAHKKLHPLRWRRYGQQVGAHCGDCSKHNTPFPRVGKTTRDKASGSYHNRIANLVGRGEESRGGGKKRRK